MLQELQVRHFEYETTRSFEDVIGTFERLVGTVEGIGWESAQNASKSVAEFESKVKENIGRSGFMRFLTIDHGRWLSLLGQPAEMRMYTIGNPLIAITMLRHNIAAGLNVPVRLVIYRDQASGNTRLTYDQTSRLTSGIGKPSRVEAAAGLAPPLAALSATVT